MRLYTKTHKNKKALDAHIKKIAARGGGYRIIKGNTIEYGFVPKSKNTDVEAMSTIDLIKEGAMKGFRRVKIEWHPAYNEKEHGHFSEKLKRTLKRAKVEIFDLIEETSDIIRLKKSENVNSLKWVK